MSSTIRSITSSICNCKCNARAPVTKTSWYTALCGHVPRSSVRVQLAHCLRPVDSVFIYTLRMIAFGGLHDGLDYTVFEITPHYKSII